MSSRAIRIITTRFVADISRWSRQMNQAQSTMTRIGQKMTAIGAKMTKAITLPVFEVGDSFTKMATEAVESENLFAESMGSMANKARAWSEELSKSLGLNAYNVRKTVGTYNVMLASMGLSEQAAYKMSTSLTELSYDMASFYNLSNEDAMAKLQSGISGEVEPLKRLGIVVNETAVKTYALNNGLIKQGQEMTDTQKVIARYMTIMEMTKKAQGDLARTLDSPSNQLRMLKERMSMLGIEIGQKLIPIMQRLMSFANGLLNAWNNLNPATQDTILAVTGVTAAIGPLILVVGALTAALAFLAANPVAAVIGGIAALATGIIVATNGFGIFEQSQRKTQDRMIKTTAEMIRQKKAAGDLGDAMLQVSYIEAKQAQERYRNDYYKQMQTYWTLLSRKAELVKRKQSESENIDKQDILPSQFRPGTSLDPEIEAADKAVKNQIEKIRQTQKQIDDAGNIMKEWEKIETPKLNIPDSVSDLTAELKALGTTGSDVYDKLTDKVKEFIDAIRSQAREFSNFVGIFEKATYDQPINMERWINRLKGQLNALKTYQQSLATLQQKANQGIIGHNVYNELAALGPSAAKQLQVVAKASNAQLQQVNSLFGQKSNIATSLAYDAVKRDMASQANIVQVINNFNGGAKDEDTTRLADKITDQVVKNLKRKGVL